jgi:hypothetical protein
MAHKRIRKFNTKDPEQKLDNDLCQVVVAKGTMVFVRGRSDRISRLRRALTSVMWPRKPIRL